MYASTMIELINRQPFQPIAVHLSDGEVLMVGYPHLISTGRNKSTFTLHSDTDDSARYVSYRNVTQVVTTDAAGA